MSDEMEQMIEQAIDGDRTVEPSPWFRRRAMHKVRAEVELPPLAFPWMRVGAGLFFAAVAAGASVYGAAVEVPAAVLLVPLSAIVFVAARMTSRRSARR